MNQQALYTTNRLSPPETHTKGAAQYVGAKDIYCRRNKQVNKRVDFILLKQRFSKQTHTSNKTIISGSSTIVALPYGLKTLPDQAASTADRALFAGQPKLPAESTRYLRAPVKWSSGEGAARFEAGNAMH